MPAFNAIGRKTVATKAITTTDTSSEVADYSGGLLAVIERAARDPNVDIEKLERLFSLKERMDAREAETAFNAAMSAAQAEMRPIAADAMNPQTRSKYASFAALDKAIRPIYTKHGFSLSFDEADCPKPDYVRVVCYVSCAGHTRIYHRDMPADGKGAKGNDVMTKTHAAGAAGSYGARYLLRGIFNLAVGEDDRDGNEDDDVMIDAKQCAELRKLIEQAGVTEESFCDYVKCGTLPELAAKHFDRAKGVLTQRINAGAGK
jgi:hypothetical protein